MRGKVQPERDVQDAARITPAYAGKRHHPEPGQSSSEDHPRVCGEKCWILSSNTPLMGSPPRMRGKAFGLVLYKVEIGITPACAGKSLLARTSSACPWDHPRVCGEKISQTRRNLPLGGSPPRMRGKVKPVLWAARVAGITPARAGKSRCPLGHHPRLRDHPRVCGEKCPPGKFFFMTVGSPPRVRGKVPSSI